LRVDGLISIKIDEWMFACSVLLFELISEVQGSTGVADTLLVDNRSVVSLWLERVTAGQNFFLFAESLLVFLLGISFFFIFQKRSSRTRKKDKLQARALQYASYAMLSLSSKGLFFLIATFAFVNIVPAIYFPQLYWHGWQFSLLWFLCFSYLFALTFTRAKKSYDTYFLVGFILFFLFLTIFYNDYFLGFPLLPFHKATHLKSHSQTSLEAIQVFFQNSQLLTYSTAIHLLLWVGLFSYVAYKIYRRSRRYTDESAKQATRLMAATFGFISLLGILGVFLLGSNLPILISQSFTMALVVMLLFYFSVLNIYKHGRYGRL